MMELASHHLGLVVYSGSCLQQSLNCLSVSLLSSYPQRSTTILYSERILDKARDPEGAYLLGMVYVLHIYIYTMAKRCICADIYLLVGTPSPGI